MKRSLKSQNTKIIKKNKTPIYLKFKEQILDLLREIGFKSLYIDKISNHYNNEMWTNFYNDYSKIDVIKFIINKPEEYHETFLEYLIQCKFKKRRAKYWNNIILFESYSNEQKLDFIIEYVCEKYKPTTDKPFLFNHTVVNTWYRYENYDFYNAESIENYSELFTNLKLKSDNHQLYYHCTSYKSALSILEEGVISNAGRKCLDFGIWPSFYMTPNINTVVEYAKYLTNLYENEICIFAFKLNKIILKKLKYLHFDSATNDWIDLTTNSRLCKNKKNKLDTYDFVFGPMVANVNQIKYKNKLAKTHNPPKFQLASKSEKSDKLLSNSIHSVIFIKK